MARIDMIAAICVVASISACMPNKNIHPDVHGHRGARGLLPENSIPAFMKAVELGCDHLEMDVVISGDGQVIVSHEPWMDHGICLLPDGGSISTENEKSFNIYHMTVPEIQEFDCGSIPLDRFPTQDQRKCFKPTLREVVEICDEHALMSGNTSPSYNIEIKSDPVWYGTFQPEPLPYVQFVIATVDSLGIADRCILQSFDVAILEALHAERPDLDVALLVENADGLEKNLARLSFTPDYYSPHYAIVTDALLNDLRERGIDLLVWTVNEKEDIKRMIDIGVDGIISDFPDRVIKLLDEGQ
ncbi:MAG: glycerophosphodiester phosphodiesterase family protein [Flavobacteriales bacterium]|nr:glycerophosphodiester phosphodiesterase [Flavobacteriales bacterium]